MGPPISIVSRFLEWLQVGSSDPASTARVMSRRIVNSKVSCVRILDEAQGLMVLGMTRSRVGEREKKKLIECWALQNELRGA